MKTVKWSAIALAAVWLSGCVVTSVCPFYTAKDVVFEPGLVGDWIDVTKNASDEVWKFQKRDDNSYRFIFIESERVSLLEAHTFKLKGQLFLDVFSPSENPLAIPPHYLLKVSQVTPTLKMSQLDQDWLTKLLEKEPNAIAHHLVSSPAKPDDVRVVLTASTADLQKFIVQNLDNTAAWGEIFELKREPASMAQQTAEKK